MTTRDRRAPQLAEGADGAVGGGSPGRRTLTRGLPAAGPAVLPEAMAPFGPMDPPDGADASARDPRADPFGLHLASAHAPTAAMATAAERAGLGDVSAVRLHDDVGAHSLADAHDARALTLGHDVYFGAGEYAPGTAEGDGLLGHELAHTAQQRSADVSALAAKPRASEVDDPSEGEADAAGKTFADAMAGRSVVPVSITAAPAAVAFDRKRGGTRSAPGINAAIKVTAYTGGGDAIEWTSRARWEGGLPVHYTGTRTGKAWSWDNSGAKSVKVNTSESGGGGEAVEPWATGHGAVRVTVHVVSLDDVTTLDALDLTDYRDPKKRGELTKHRSGALGHALPGEHAGDGSTDQVTSKTNPASKRIGGDAGERSTARNPGRSSPAGRDGTDSAAAPEPEAGTGNGTESPNDQRDDGADFDAEAAEDEAEAEADDAALDAATEALLDVLGIPSTDGEDGQGGNGDHAGGSPTGRTGADTSPDGTGQGGDRARPGGGTHGGKYGRDLDGVDAEHDDVVGGQKDPTATAGRVGGEEDGGDGGVRGGGGFSLFGFTIAIPAAYAGAVELALLIESGNVIGFGPKMVQKAASEATEQLVKKGGTAALRRSLKRAAAEETAKSMRAIRKEIAAAKTASKRLPVNQLTKRQRQLLAEWGHLTAEEAKRAMRVTSWELQRRYFQSALKSAKAEGRALRKSLGRTKDLGKRADLRRRLDQVDALAEAAQVQPIAGRLPIGHRFAGQNFPASKLPKKYRAGGLRIDANGFPDFEPYAYTLKNGKKSVRIEYTGSRDADFRAANKAAGLTETPEDYVWHHHQELGEMMLIPEDLHDAVKHTGGVATYKHTTGIENYD